MPQLAAIEEGVTGHCPQIIANNTFDYSGLHSTISVTTASDSCFVPQMNFHDLVVELVSRVSLDGCFTLLLTEKVLTLFCMLVLIMNLVL